MELISQGDFEAWLQSVGANVKTRHSLEFSACDDRHAWSLPGSDELVTFVESLFGLAAREEGWYCYPYGGVWDFATPGGPWNGEAIEVVTRGLGIPASYEGAVRLQWSEMPGVMALAVNSLVFGWSVGEDLYFVPSNGAVIFKTSHHSEIIGHFPSVDARCALLERLARAGA